MNLHFFLIKKIISSTLFIFLIILFYFNTPLVYAQSDISDNAAPFIRNYSPKEYQANIINMNVKKDNNGILYFTNVSGILQFDGKTWRTIDIPKVAFTRSLDIDNEETVFIGAINTIGMLETGSTGEKEFVPLMDLIDKGKRNFGEVWKVKATTKGVFFVTDKYLFRYYQGKITTWEARGKYFYSAYEVYKETYVLDSYFGLLKVEGDSLNMLYDKEDITSLGVYFILPYTQEGKKEILIGRNKDNFLIYNLETNTTRPFESELTQDEVNSIYHGILGQDGNYYISTIRNGVICLNPKGKKIFHITSQNGLSTDKVYAAELDEQGNLWLALVEGIGKIETGSPFKKYNEEDDLVGIVTAIKLSNNTTLLNIY
ncbi:hypothetical protein ACE193_20710 [Bernardetia sp. OM2101]|uniref:hypothetical protein n=1 Tax=Bernardetia sp. OM2101 TaxID=3344876 RepID=UPI0035CF82CF